MGLQIELNRLAGTTNRSKQACANILAGTTANPRSTQEAMAIYAGVTNRSISIQQSINIKAGVVARNRSSHDASKLIP